MSGPEAAAPLTTQPTPAEDYAGIRQVVTSRNRKGARVGESKTNLKKQTAAAAAARSQYCYLQCTILQYECDTYGGNDFGETERTP